VLLSRWPLTWNTWKSQGIPKWWGKSQGKWKKSQKSQGKWNQVCFFKLQILQNYCVEHGNAVRGSREKRQEMNVGTEMFLEVYGRQKLKLQTECHVAECSRTLRLQPETSDGRLLTDGMTGRAAAGWKTTVDADNQCSVSSSNDLIWCDMCGVFTALWTLSKWRWYI